MKKHLIYLTLCAALCATSSVVAMDTNDIPPPPPPNFLAPPAPKARIVAPRAITPDQGIPPSSGVRQPVTQPQPSGGGVDLNAIQQGLGRLRPTGRGRGPVPVPAPVQANELDALAPQVAETYRLLRGQGNNATDADLIEYIFDRASSKKWSTLSPQEKLDFITKVTISK